MSDHEPIPRNDTDIGPSGIVPPYLSKEWRALRKRLHEASVAAGAAALESTPEGVRRHLGESSIALIDADFMLRRIETGRVPHVHEKSQLQESAQGGMYCAACGEAVPDAD